MYNKRAAHLRADVGAAQQRGVAGAHAEQQVLAVQELHLRPRPPSFRLSFCLANARNLPLFLFIQTRPHSGVLSVSSVQVSQGYCA